MAGCLCAGVPGDGDATTNIWQRRQILEDLLAQGLKPSEQNGGDWHQRLELKGCVAVLDPQGIRRMGLVRYRLGRAKMDTAENIGAQQDQIFDSEVRLPEEEQRERQELLDLQFPDGPADCGLCRIDPKPAQQPDIVRGFSYTKHKPVLASSIGYKNERSLVEEQLSKERGGSEQGIF